MDKTKREMLRKPKGGVKTLKVSNGKNKQKYEKETIKKTKRSKIKKEQ